MKKKTVTQCVAAAVLLAAQIPVHAHISYRDLGIENPWEASVTSNTGWIDGADADLGNSHNLRWFSFTLATDAYVTIEVSNTGTPIPASNGTGYTEATPVDVLTDLDPAFTLYSGLLPAGAYDSATALPVDPGMEGRFNALGDMSMANSSGVIGTIHYITHRNEFSGAATESLVNFFLTAGSYSLATGGGCASCDPADHAVRGVMASLEVTPVPLPAAVYLLGSALVGMGVISRRRREEEKTTITV